MNSSTERLYSAWVLVGGDRAVRTDGDEALLALDAAFDDIDFAAGRMEPQAEAAQFVIPDNHHLAGAHRQIDAAFGEFRHAALTNLKLGSSYHIATI